MTSSASAPAVITQAFVYALDPTPEQATVMLSHVGASRFAYNALLQLVRNNWDENRAKKEVGVEVTKEDYLSTSHFGLLYLWAEHRDELAPWWAENGTCAYNDAAQRLSKAFTNFRKGQAKFPRFKRRGQSGSVRFTSQAARLADSHHVRLSRIGEVKTYESTRKLFRHLERGTGRIVAATLRFHNANWSISFTAQVTRQVPITRDPERIVGVDVGLTNLYTGATPSGSLVLEVANPHHLLKAQCALAHAQRVASRRQGPRNGVAPSNRWTRANSRVQNIHTQIVNARRDQIHQVTTRLAKDYDVIVIENLNVRGMLKNHHLARHISDAGFGEFARQLEYMTKWYGSTLVKADRFYPSSKTCSHCGTVRATLSLRDRNYVCDVCGLKVDRDLNAATNLARMGLPGTHSGTGRGGKGKTGSVRTAHPSEASTEAHILVDA
ncbi:MAG: IS607 family element RNA-guided endonuclease TnpB [Acidimicrobiales bacterium]